MNKDLGVWTSEEAALVLIDYQKEQLESIRSETPADLIEFHVRWLVKVAKAFDVPIVLSTVGVGYGFNSPTQPAILAELPDIEPIDRSSMDSFEDKAFRDAVAATGRKRLIFGGLQTEVCLAFAVVDALKDGYEAQFVTDAVGSRSQIEHRTAIGVFCELFRDWAGPLGEAAQELSGWYFREVPKVTDTVGVADAEARRAQPQPAAK